MYQERPVFRVVTSAGEAEEHLRVIRQAMERSTKHSTLSGLSGVLVGILALIGCALTQFVTPNLPYPRLAFILVWGLVTVLSLVTDIVLTKRRAVQVGKTASSALGKHLIRAASPGMAVGVILSLFYLMHPNLIRDYIYGIWMVCYAVALLAFGMFSLKEVSALGWAFLIAGAITLLVPTGTWFPPSVVGTEGNLVTMAQQSPIGLWFPPTMMAVAFGGLHIGYGIWMGRKYGW